MSRFKWTTRTNGGRQSQATFSSNDRLVGFRESAGVVVFVAVRSHRPGVRLSDEVAKPLARDYLTEIGWFGEESLAPDFIF